MKMQITDRSQIHELALLAQAAYLPKDTRQLPGSWIHVQELVVENSFPLSPLFLKFLDGEDPLGKSFGFQAYNPTLNVVLVAYRGTRSVEELSVELECGVHDGYEAGFDAIFGCLTKPIIVGPRIPMVILGHSLGGALAIMGALRMVTQTDYVCTFGCPRVLSTATLAKAEKLFNPENAVRVTNKLDPIPDLPPAIFGLGHLFPPTVVDSGAKLLLTAHAIASYVEATA